MSEICSSPVSEVATSRLYPGAGAVELYCRDLPQMSTAGPTTCPSSKRPAAISVLRQTGPVTQRQNGWIRRLRRLPVILLVFIVLGVCVWSGREPILRGAAHLWIVSDPVTQADAAVVLGGGLGSRPFAAAELYK